MNAVAPAPPAKLDIMRGRALVFDYIHDGVIVTTPDGIITDWNAGAERMFGWSREEVLGLTPAILHRQDEALVLTDSINAAAVKDGRWVGEITFVRKDGSVGICETVTVPLRDEVGRIFATVGVNREITARKFTEETLAVERLLLRTVIDAIADPIFFKDRIGRHLIMNEANRRLFGVTNEEHLGKTVFEWPIAPEHAELYAADDESVMGSGIPITNREEPYVAVDGRKGWFLTSKIPLRDNAGIITGLVGIARDITGRKQAEDEMARLRRRLVDHVDNSPLAVIEWSPSGHVLHWAGQAEAIFEWLSVEALGRSAKDLGLVHPDDQEKVDAANQELLSGRTSRAVVRHRNVTKSGNVVHCAWNYSILRDPDGQPVSILSLAADITDRVHAQRAATDSQIARAALERKMLETQKLESLGVLAGGIAHDFNNLLTGVLGHASLLLEETHPSSPQHASAEQIEIIATRAADLCKQMLAYSGKGRFVLQQLDLDDMVEETAKLLQVSINKKAVMRFRLGRPLPPLLGDATQLRQIVMNLVINAAEAIGEMNGYIDIRTGVLHADRACFAGAVLSPELPEADYVFLEVSDTGSGMTPDVRARIFDPFFTTKFTGRGLGLAAVLGIVRGHGGALIVESEPGMGTTFRALFPKGEGTPDLTAEPTHLGNDKFGLGGRVLVVDDEDIVRRITARLLQVLGFEVVLAVDGREALSMFDAGQGNFDLVMLDLTMPRMDGEETFHELMDRKSDVCVLLMSGFDEAEAMARFAGLGLAGFIQKPFKLATLRSKLRGIVRLHVPAINVEPGESTSP